VVVAGFHQAVAEAMAGLDASEDGSGGSCPQMFAAEDVPTTMGGSGASFATPPRSGHRRYWQAPLDRPH
jgi:hypothetical protein